LEKETTVLQQRQPFRDWFTKVRKHFYIIKLFFGNLVSVSLMTKVRNHINNTPSFIVQGLFPNVSQC